VITYKEWPHHNWNMCMRQPLLAIDANVMGYISPTRVGSYQELMVWLDPNHLYLCWKPLTLPQCICFVLWLWRYLYWANVLVFLTF